MRACSEFRTYACKFHARTIAHVQNHGIFMQSQIKAGNNRWQAAECASKLYSVFFFRINVSTDTEIAVP